MGKAKIATNTAMAICLRCKKIIEPYHGRAIVDYSEIVFEHVSELGCAQARDLDLGTGEWKEAREPRMPIQILRDRRQYLDRRRNRLLRHVESQYEDQAWRSVMDTAADLREVETEIGVIDKMLAGEWKWEG